MHPCEFVIVKPFQSLDDFVQEGEGVVACKKTYEKVCPKANS